LIGTMAASLFPTLRARIDRVVASGGSTRRVPVIAH